MEGIVAVKFNVKDRPEFYQELKKRVNRYFKENGISKNANLNMKLKTAFMLLLYFSPWVLMIGGIATGTWAVLGMWLLMSLGMSGIGLSIMHDANHGSYSKDKRVNYALGFLIAFIGGYHTTWKIQHNVLHHSFTNIDGYDEDISKQGIIRFSPIQKRKSIFKFQAFYAPFLYGIMTIYWLVGKDFEQLIRYNKKNLLEGQGVTLSKAIMQVILNKIGYYSLFIAIPLIAIDLPWWQILGGFFLMHFIAGLILAFIFQLAHVIEETDFYKTDENGSVENNWAIHQLRTTANFANENRLFSWLIGGLNYQVEHHLFPNICHVHYPKISIILKETAKEYNLPYLQHKTFFGAIKSHFSLLNQLGTGKYDLKLAG